MKRLLPYLVALATLIAGFATASPASAQGSIILQLQQQEFSLDDSAKVESELSAPQKFAKQFIELVAAQHFVLVDKTKRETWTKTWLEQIAAIQDDAEADDFNRRALRSLDQRFDYYFDREETKANSTETDPTFVGIGCRIELRDAIEIIDAFPEKITGAEAKKLLIASHEHPVVLTPFPESPAGKAGILPGDLLLKVDGKELDGMTVDEVIELIKGKEDTLVELTVGRSQSGASATEMSQPIVVTRGKWTAPVVHTRTLADNVSYIKLDHFMAEKAAEEMLKALTAAGKVKDGKIILDLRDNGGGRLDHAINIVSYMLAEGSIVTLNERRGDDMINIRTYTTLDGTITSRPADFNRGIGMSLEPKVLAVPVDMPIVVLVNGNSASASEITAGALKFNGRAVIVGETTRGKGVGQTVLTLEGRSTRITKFFFLPAGRETDFEGVHPDREASLKGEVARLKQLRKELRDALSAVAQDGATAEASVKELRAKLRALHAELAENDPQLEAAREAAALEFVRITTEAKERTRVREEAVKQNHARWQQELENRATKKVEHGSDDEE